MVVIVYFFFYKVFCGCIFYIDNDVVVEVGDFCLCCGIVIGWWWW